MNKKNENEKTFADLFSSINNEEEKDSNTKISQDNDKTSFNSIFNKSEELGNKEEENIFANTEPVQEETKEEENIFTNIESIPEENKEEQNIFPNTEPVQGEIKESENIFTNIEPVQEAEKEEENIFTNTESDQEDNKETDNIFTNIEPSQEESKELEENPFFEDNEQKGTNINNKQENPFFENSINLIESQKLTNNNKIDTSNIKHYNVKIVNKKEPFIKFLIGVASYAIFILLLLIGITLLIYVADLKIKEAKGDTSPPKYNAFEVLTGSMLPEIQVYDVVVTKRVEIKDLKVGDVITFSSSDSRFAGTTITHRIIKVNKPEKGKSYTFQTKGDNNNVADSALVQENNIYGKVIIKIPKLGYLREFLASEGGWILVILLPCLAVVSYDIVTLAKGIKRKRNKKLKIQK